ncbi:MAG: hypothetical protein KKB66_11340 [Alphaproteobacteria bacterium]|nr:hypothetical protein [Alphaproteobacteria bacterium]MBU0804994.1 hypothetical protein [Alphaproteobacteria bacterium]MBU0870493.1 hypothetical protein [Alphaproteobacteria bacterium]MBU1401832.1 hypothetical protein [Alphaproteobacteria bacterium]MBU1591751.1 hypothetical protein [Alphaproteobacteria bacterium]
MMDTSPRAAGPAGPQFEAKVATHYALAVLAQTEAFGLPGAIVDRLEFQRGGQGHPLDDIIVRGTTLTGEQKCLEVQAKRSISFTENDEKFAAVVAAIVRSRKMDAGRRFAVALERTSGPIENGVQEALELSRHATDAQSFLALLDTPGRGNKDMRRFIGALTKNLADHGLDTDDIVFEVARSFSVLVFDYARPNSIAEHHDRMRARQLATGANQGSHYDVLFGLILRSDAIGGETNRSHLIHALREKGIEIGASPNLAKARERIEEVSQFALSDIKTTVSRQWLGRTRRRRQLEELLEEAEPVSRVVEITGPGGAGKSGLLKSAVEGRRVLSRVLVLAPDRTPPGGWPALRNQFSIDATAEQFLQDLSCDGGGLICIDGLDRFRDEAQLKTVIDVLNSALNVQGVTLLFTARPGWQEQAALAFGEELLASLKTPRQLHVEGLDDAEAADLATAAPELAPLLQPSHPAKALARNPFILRRLLSTRLKTDGVLSEAELAWDWWGSGAHVVGGTAGDTQARRRVLLCVAIGMLDGEILVSVAGQDASAVATLIADGVLVQISTDRVKFEHDLFADWGIACALSEEPQRINTLPLEALPPFWLSRGIELAFRRVAESDVSAYPNIIKDLECSNANGGWIALALLALVRSEHATILLSRYSELLLEGKGERAANLIRRVIASHGRPAEVILKDVIPSGVSIPKYLILPAGPQWPELILWCLNQFDRLPPSALAAALSLFEGWLTLSAFGEKNLSPHLLERLADVLIAEIEEHEWPLSKRGDALHKFKYAVATDALERARFQLALYARSSPSAANRYLLAIAKSNQPYRWMAQLLESRGNLASAAPAAFGKAFLDALNREVEDNASKRERAFRPPSRLEGPFLLGRCGIALFAELLVADSECAIDLIRGLVELDEGPEELDAGFVLKLAGEERRISPTCSYGWSRGNAPTTIVAMALKALESSSHKRIDAGERLDDVVKQLLGDGPLSGALLLIIVDLVLSHSPLDGRLLAELVASTELLTLDATRAQHDIANKTSGGKLELFPHSNHPADAEIERSLAARVSRTVALHDAITQIVLLQPYETTADLRAKLASAVARLGVWADPSIDWTSEHFMATHAQRLASKANYDVITETGADGSTSEGWSFRWPEAQVRWSQEQTARLVAEQTALTRSFTLRMAMDDEQKPVTATVADAEAVLFATAEVLPPQQSDQHDPHDAWMARVAAAAFLARFGTDENVGSQKETLSAVFDLALQQPVRQMHNLRFDVMYDSQALAIAGRLYLASRFQCAEDGRALLTAVASAPGSAASALSRHRRATKDIGHQLVHSAVRLGLQACEFSRQKHYDEDQAVFDARYAKLSATKAARLTRELHWIAHGGDEPAWPSPPLRRNRRPKRSIRLPGGLPKPRRARVEPQWPDTYFDDHTAIIFLRILQQSADPRAILGVLDANHPWLIDANGRGDEDDESSDFERIWTRALFECVATRAKTWADSERDKLIFEVLDQFGDEAFIDTAAAFLVKSDLCHIEGAVADTQYLVDLRTRLWARLKTTIAWQRHCQSSRGGVEIHLNELILAFFCKVDRGFGHATSYTKGLNDLQIVPLLPVLTEITASAGGCPSIARLFLDLVELIEPQTAEPFLLRAATKWSSRGDQRFWNELGIGQRVCSMAERATIPPPGKNWIEIADAIAATGVVAGETIKRTLSRR